MKSPAESWVDSTMARIASEPGLSAYAQAPIYVYGNKAFFSQTTNHPPQIRWTLAGGTVNAQRTLGGLFATTGSVGSFQQDMVCSVWGASEYDCFVLTMAVIRALKSDPNQTFDDISYDWVDLSENANKQGEKVQLTVTVQLPIPTLSASLATILSASYVVNTSDALSGSTLLPWHSGTITSSL